MKFEEQFYRFPFLYLGTALIAGIVTDALLISREPNSILLVVVVLFLLVLLLLKRFSVIGDQAFIVSAMLLTGFLLHESRKTSQLLFPENEETSVTLKVTEFDESDNIWKKGIGLVTSTVGNSGFETAGQRVLFYVRSDLRAGDILLVRTKWKQIRNKQNPGEFDAESYWRSKGILQTAFISDEELVLLDHHEESFLTGLLTSMRRNFSRVLDRSLTSDVRGIGKAILLGDRSDLDTETRNSFSNAGAMHVLAVSGLHVGIIMVILLAVFKRFSRFIPRKRAIILVLILSWIYALITGLSPSVLRAVIMFSIILTGGLISRKVNPINTLFLAAMIMLFYDPDFLFDMGFQLSYLALLGIFLLYKPIADLIYVKNGILKKAWEGTAVGIAAQLLTLPVTLYYFHQFPNYFFLSNLGVMALAGVILGLGVFLFSLSWSSLAVKVIGFLLGITLLGLLFFIQLVESLPGSVAKGFELSIPYVMLFYILIFALVVNLGNAKRVLWVLSGFILFLLIVQFDRTSKIPSNELVVFNAKDPVIAIKNGTKVVCLYDPGEKTERQARRLMEDYMKISPGEVQYIEMGRGDYSFGGSMKGHLFVRDDVIRFESVNFRALLKVLPFSTKNESGTWISLPQFRDPECYDLGQGAFQKEL